MSGFNKRTRNVLHFYIIVATDSQNLSRIRLISRFFRNNNDYMKTRMPVGNVSELKAKSKRNSQT